ncbi:MAG: tetratricopeptide repeat protein [Spirochaetota bacterium]
MISPKTAKALIILLLWTSAAFAQNGAPAETKDDGFKKATKYFFQKKYDMAELLLQEELKKNPENGAAYSYLGDIFLQKKQYDAALSLYQKAVELKTDGGEDYFRIGQIYYYKQLADLSIQNFKKAYEMDPKLKISHYQIGLSYLMLVRDKKNVIASWEEYLRLSPEDPQYEKIRRAIELLKDPNFEIPPAGSDISIEEALHLGGAVLQKTEVKAEDTSAGHEKKKTVNKTEDIFRDDTLQ